MHALKLRQIGSSTGLILPKELLTLLRARKGQEVYAVETPNGFTITTLNPEVRKQIEIGESIMDRYKDTFAALAK